MFVKSIAALAVGGTLAACGSTTSPGTNITYRTFTNTESVTTQLVGQQLGAVLSDGISPASVGALNGSITHDTQAYTIGVGTDTSTYLSDSDGPDNTGALQGAPANAAPQSSHTAQIGGLGFSGSYDYVQPASYINVIAPVLPPNFIGILPFSGYRSEIGFLGVATDAGDVPMTGTVSYSGEAVGQVNFIGGTRNSWDGVPATVTADFLNGNVGMTVTHMAGGNTDVLSISGMAISGATFGGGTPSLTRNGTAVDVSESSFYQAAGNLYGYDPSLTAPDEVGISTRGIGDGAFFNMTVLAD